ncbi:MAG: hypothetical protein ACI4RC_06115 [Oscillospiraceae bacterium]
MNERDNKSKYMIAKLEKEIKDITNEGDKLTDLILETNNKFLLKKLDALAEQKDKLEYELSLYKENDEQAKLTEENIREAIKIAQDLFISGKSYNVDYLVSEFIERIDVFDNQLMSK